MADDDFTTVWIPEQWVFRAAGSWISFVASFAMVGLIVGDANTRAQVRPRLLAVLALLDAAAALFSAIVSVPAVHGSGMNAYSISFIVVELLSIIFQFSSFTWTCVLGFHMQYSVRMSARATPLAINGSEEAALEKRYLGVLFVLMGCLFVPLCIYFVFGPTGVYSGKQGEINVDGSYIYF